MKQLQILMLLLFTSSVIAQITENKSTCFIEVNVARYAETPGLFKNYSYENKINFLNGFNFGFKKNENTEMYFTLLKVNSTFNEYYGYTAELYSSKGYQLGFGLKKRLFHKNRFSAQIGGEILFQLINYVGDYWTDYGTFSVSNIKTYEIGIASLFQFNYKISDKFAISINTRAGAYHRQNSSNDDFNTNGHFNFLFEPINSFGIRVNL